MSKAQEPDSAPKYELLVPLYYFPYLLNETNGIMKLGGVGSLSWRPRRNQSLHTRDAKTLTV
jgi:hypothetical protein